ncbi:MAG: hypothetical protein DRH12_12535 [Deltaproteobacteria bacterium]|nr:MAG: hypothetical protein DRH12_12535 [Deltaproteobacteria bacterium]
MASKIPVIYILGYGRSGSTLLDGLLGSIRGCVSCGEIIGLWRDVNQANSLCSCGQKLENCQFWGQIVKSVLAKNGGRLPASKAEDILSLISMKRIVPIFFSRTRSQGFSKAINRFKATTAKLYYHIRDLSGARVIIDSSKHPAYAKLLCEVESLDVRIIHLVRDSRAVVYSNIRRRLVPNMGYTAVQNPFRTIAGWSIHNLLANIQQRENKGYFQRIRYEDLSRSPRPMLVKVMKDAGLYNELGLTPGHALPFFRDANTACLQLGHVVSGNAFRFVSGDVTVQPDTTWNAELNLAYKLIASILTAPLLKQYGYRLKWTID